LKGTRHGIEVLAYGGAMTRKFKKGAFNGIAPGEVKKFENARDHRVVSFKKERDRATKLTHKGCYKNYLLQPSKSDNPGKKNENVRMGAVRRGKGRGKEFHNKCR